MKNRIKEKLPAHIISVHSDSDLFVADYKNFNNGEVVIGKDEPQDIGSVYLNNKYNVEVCFDGFKDNALPVIGGDNCSQCECVIFPNRCHLEDWILFIELKYAYCKESAFNKDHNYPNCMMDQIISTVEYFRRNDIIPQEKQVKAIVAFPELIKSQSAFILSPEDITRISLDNKITIRGTRSATIKSETRLKLNSYQ